MSTVEIIVGKSIVSSDILFTEITALRNHDDRINDAPTRELIRELPLDSFFMALRLCGISLLSRVCSSFSTTRGGKPRFWKNSDNNAENQIELQFIELQCWRVGIFYL